MHIPQPVEELAAETGSPQSGLPPRWQ